ncbi:MAG: glycosyltransferase family 39 protein [Thermoplasmata archaeon]|nr:glycosyltransferase family 39 protein [Thermoplasmata archaeon]
MSAPTAPEEALAAARRALERVRTLRTKGIPFDPLGDIAALRSALAGEGSDMALVTAAELEVNCTRVELAWAELDMRRATVAFQVLALRRRPEGSRSSLVTAEEFLRDWNAPFADALTVESRVWLARRLEARMAEEGAELPPGGARLGAPVDRPPAEVDPEGSETNETFFPPAAPTVEHLPPVPEKRLPFSEWIRTPSGLTFLLLSVFVVVAAYVRLHDLGQLSLWNDEAQSTLVAFSIVQYGYPVIHAQHLINNFEPLYPYFEALSIAVLGHSNFAYRLPSAIMGIALVPLSYYLGSRLRDRYVGITLAAMTAFSSEFIAWSRQARWYILLVLLMSLAFLVATAWSHTTERRRRTWLLITLLVLGGFCALASVGLFLLYIPPILAGAIVYLVAVHWTELRAFFGLARTPDAAIPPARYVPYWFRQLLAVLLPLAAIVVVLVAPDAVGSVATRVLARAVGFTPYPLVWSPIFGSYLVGYYLGILVLVGFGALFMLWRRRPLDLALLTFCLVGFVSVSSLASLTNDIASGTTSFERHLLPLIYFLFVVAAIGLVEAIRLVYLLLRRIPLRLPHLRGTGRPVAFGVLVVILLVLPSVVVPSGQTVHQKSFEFPTGELTSWVPFSLDPSQPSAVYQADQADYQLAADWVIAHRNATDVVASTNPGAPEVYLGPVQYWVRGNALNNTVITVNGQPAFFQTGSLLVPTAIQLVPILLNSSGWLISDVPNVSGPPYAGDMNLVVKELMSKVAGGSDSSVSLFSWGVTTPLQIVTTICNNTASLRKLAENTGNLLDWVATNGTTWSTLRPVFLPLESYLVGHTSSGFAYLAVLADVYNHRPDLRAQFPEVLNSTGPNDPGLLHWAKEVVDGILSDPDAATLEPYKAQYDHYG